MEPTTSYNTRFDPQIPPDRDQEQAWRDRSASEERDRVIVRRELERGVPEAEIEEQLAIASDFVRLNPGQDVRGYVRTLIEEEKGGFHALSASVPPSQGRTLETDPARLRQSLSQPVRPELTEPQHRGEIPQGIRPQSGTSSEPRGRIAAAEASVRDYVNGNFKPDDWLAMVAINRKTGETLQRISPARNIVSSDYQRWLRYLNATGSDVYLSLNTFKEHARGRTKEDLKDIRHLYLDLDEEGARKLEAIRHDSAVPPPNYVLNTSPGKFQVIWRVEGIGQEEAEGLLRELAGRYGGDRAATDSTRVFRLPSFSNKKYKEDFRVTISREAPTGEVRSAEDFRVDAQARSRAGTPAPAPAARRSSSIGNGTTQSEKDWAYAIRKLRAAEDPAVIIRDMARYRSADRYDKNDSSKLVAPAKPNPRYYAEHTVTQAMAYLGITKPAPTPASSAASSREPGAEPSR